VRCNLPHLSGLGNIASMEGEPVCGPQCSLSCAAVTTMTLPAASWMRDGHNV
jgi:hypothetical protein